MFIAVPIKTLKSFSRLADTEADAPFFEEFLCGRSRGQIRRVIIQRGGNPSDYIIVWASATSDARL